MYICTYTVWVAYEWDPPRPRATLLNTAFGLATQSLPLKTTTLSRIEIYLLKTKIDGSRWGRTHSEESWSSYTRGGVNQYVSFRLDWQRNENASSIPEFKMKSEYDFSKARRGAVVAVPKTKEKITIRLDREVVDWFRGEVDRAGGGNYQSLINDVLRRHVERSEDSLEKTLRRVIREELRRAS